MKVLICSLKYAHDGKSRNYDYIPAPALAYITSALKQAGHTVEFLNPNHHEGSAYDLLAGRLKTGHDYDFLMTGGLSAEYRLVREIVHASRALSPELRIVVGGGLISTEPELMFETLKPDYAVIGEGERTIVELLNAVETGSDTGGVPGVGYLKEGRYAFSGVRPQADDVDAIAWPDYEAIGFREYLDARQHMRSTYQVFDEERVYGLIGSRSCPFQCTFCYHPLGPKYKERSNDSMMAEIIARVTEYRINILHIYDELFAHKKHKILDFCNRMKEFRKGLGWDLYWACNLRVPDVDDDVLRNMKDAGCEFMTYGFESYSPEVLKSMNKHITPDQMDRAVELTVKNRITIEAMLIFGDRAETLDTARQSLEFYRRYNYVHIGLSFIRPYPGSKLYQYCIERGLIKDRLDFIENHLTEKRNMSETMTDREFDQLKLMIDIWQRKYSLYSVADLIEEAGDGNIRAVVKCPRCGATNDFKRLYLAGLKKFMFLHHTSCRHCRASFYIVSRGKALANRALVLIHSLIPGPLRLFFYTLFKKLKYGIHEKL